MKYLVSQPLGVSLNKFSIPSAQTTDELLDYSFNKQCFHEGIQWQTKYRQSGKCWRKRGTNMWCGAPLKKPSSSSTENVDNTFDLYRQLAGSCQHGKGVVSKRAGLRALVAPGGSLLWGPILAGLGQGSWGLPPQKCCNLTF